MGSNAMDEYTHFPIDFIKIGTKSGLDGTQINDSKTHKVAPLEGPKNIARSSWETTTKLCRDRRRRKGSSEQLKEAGMYRTSIQIF